MSSTTLLATDQQRSVVNTLKANHPPQPIAYSPYGHCPVMCGFFSLLGFNGVLRDPVTEHYSLGKGYRAFIPALMRFNRPDNLSPFGEGGLNPYAYCFGDPTNLQDPTGHSPIGHWRVITRRLMATTDFKSRIAELKATRLLAEQSNLSTLIKLKHRKSFRELHDNAQKIYNPNTKIQKLETLALEKFQDLPKSVKSTAPPKFLNAPNISKAKKDLNEFNKAALRDQSGEITGFDMRFLRKTHFNIMQQHPEVALARKLLSDVSQKILELRSG